MKQNLLSLFFINLFSIVNIFADGSCDLGAELSTCIGSQCPAMERAIDSDGDCIEDNSLTGYPWTFSGSLSCTSNSGSYRPLPFNYPANLVRGYDEAFNAVIVGDLTLTQGAEIEGRTAIGGNLINNNSVFYGIGESGGGTYVVCPTNMKSLIIRGTAFNGNGSFGAGGTGVLIGGVYDPAENTFPNWLPVTDNVGTSAAALGIDIDDVMASISSKSTFYATLTETATTAGGTNGDGTSTCQVFHLSSVPANTAFSNIPDGATVIVNVSGTNPSVNNFGAAFTDPVGGGNASVFNLLWNFYEATSLTIPNFRGTVIAPLADVRLTGGNFDGRLFVGGNLEVDGAGHEIHNYAFGGALPCETTVACPNLDIATEAENICEGNDINLTATSTDNIVSWSWSGPNGFSSSDQNPTIAAADTLAKGDYTVTVTDDAACTATSLVNVDVQANIPTQEICDGQIIEAEAEAGHTSYQWYKDGIAIPAVDGGDLQTYIITTAGSYNYTIDGEPLNGSCTNQMCCPIVVIETTCPEICPTNRCIPLMITQTN